MALTPRFGHTMLEAASPVFALQAFLDYTCPFCKRMFQRLTVEVIPWLNKTHPGKISITAFSHVQPWHPQGSCMAEAVLAVDRLDKSAYNTFVGKLYETRDDRWVDSKIMDKSRNQLYDELAELAGECGVDAGKVRGLLAVTAEGNAGNAVTKEMKVYAKYCRKNGVHVSPTVYVNGIEDGRVSSGWTLEQWQEYFEGGLATGDEKK